MPRPSGGKGPGRPPPSSDHTGTSSDDALVRASGAGVGAIALRAPSKGVNPALVYHNAKAEGSRPAIRSTLARIAGWLLGKPSPATWAETIELPWWELRNRHVQMIRARLIEVEAAPRTINRDMSMIRSVLHVAWANEQMTTDQYMRAVDVKGVERDTTKAGRALALDEIKALFDTCRDGTAEELERRGGARRAAAILALMYGAGLRRIEIARLRVEDVDLENSVLAVRGKRNKPRTVYLDPGWIRYVKWWLDVRGSPPEGSPLFKCKAWTVWRIVIAVREAAGVKPFTPHDLRRSFASHLLSDGKDLGTLQQLMGHSDVRTTLIYDRRNEAEQKEAVTTVSPDAVGLDDVE